MNISGFWVDVASFGSGIRHLSELNQKTQAQNLLGFARTTLTNRDGSGLVDITPPGSQGRVGLSAKQQGEHAIERDLSKVFAAVTVKHQRPEQFPDPEAIHTRLFVGKRPGTPLRSDRGRQKYYVDRLKLKQLATKLKTHVGRLAAGWLPSTHKLNVRAPAWIERHGGGNGEIRVQLTSPMYEIEMTIIAPDNAPIEELERRVKYALTYTEGRVARAVEGALAAQARKAGFAVGE